MNDLGTGGRSYFGGRCEPIARATLDLPIPLVPRDLTLRDPVRVTPADKRPILH